MSTITGIGDDSQHFSLPQQVISLLKLFFMNKDITPEIREVMEALHYRPAVSVIIPFEPKMMLKAALVHSLKNAADKVERELKDNYNSELSSLVMRKLRRILGELNFSTHKRSIAIYVSPVFEKILYLDIPVEEKIIVDESFEIRDLVYSKKQLHKYLVLLVSSKETRMYLGNADTFVRIISNTPEAAAAYMYDAPERVANFTDPVERKEILLEKFLRHIDNTLDIILNAYHLPLFVMGTEKTLGHFKKLTKHQAAVVEYIQGNYEDEPLEELKDILQPHIANWKKVKQKDLLNQLEEAADNHKLAAGMRDVWREAMSQKGKLLLVEKDYMYAAQHGSSEEIIYKAIEPYNKFSCIKDAVDDVIEKVLENGGDVEFVEKDLLKKYHHIVLVKYY
jgi:Bacterial archaeo-eukaryotic release factor family 3